MGTSVIKLHKLDSVNNPNELRVDFWLFRAIRAVSESQAMVILELGGS